MTLINYNSPVPPQVSTLTFAHEVGHNFGSPVSIFLLRLIAQNIIFMLYSIVDITETIAKILLFMF